MNIAERFGASIQINRPELQQEQFFLVKRDGEIEHDAFMTGLLGLLGRTDRLVFHHRSGFAIVQLPYDQAQKLKRNPWITFVGGVQFDFEQFNAIIGSDIT